MLDALRYQIVSFRRNVAESKTMSLQGLSHEIDFKNFDKNLQN